MASGAASVERRRQLFLALDLLTHVAYVVNSGLDDEGLAQLTQPLLDELRALLIAEVRLANEAISRSLRRDAGRRDADHTETPNGP